MQDRRLLQLFLALSSLFLSEARHVIGSGRSCVRSSPAGDGRTRVTFLQEDAAGARSLYLSLWSEDTSLVTCEINTNPVDAERYRALCDGSNTPSQQIARRFDISALVAPDAPCAHVSSYAPELSGHTWGDGTEGRVRRKRAWMFPGTLWCGLGSRAVGYEELGMFESTDRCCREHDHCLHIIPAFTVNYGVFNSKFFTVSLCDCDQRFRQCLLSVNDTISSMVGYSFFSILQVPCFELKQQRRCTQMFWSGMCKSVKKAPYAVFKSPLPYNSSDVTSNNITSAEGTHVTVSPVIDPTRKAPEGEHRCSSRDPPRGDTFYPRRKKGKGCKRYRKLYKVAPSQITPMSAAHTPTPSMDRGLLNASKSVSIISKTRGDGKKRSAGKGRLDHPTRRGQVHPQVTTNSYPQTTSTTRSTPSLKQEPAPQLRLPAAITAATKTTKSPKNVPKQRLGGLEMLLKDATFRLYCKRCLDQNTTSHVTSVTHPTTTYGLPITVTDPETLQLMKTPGTPKRDTLKALLRTATSAAPIATNLKTVASKGEDGKPQKHLDSHFGRSNSTQEPTGGFQGPNKQAERGLTGKQLLCGSLKHLDECRYKIPPFENKYDLQNTESKTAYHCDCTSRLAVQIESLKRPTILPTLLRDFVAERCFKLPKEKKCHSRKSCSRGFTKASDLLQALKKIEEKDTAGVRNSVNDRKRGIPVRLYKRCLRLEKRS